MNEDMLILTPSALISFLSEIEELKDLELEISEGSDTIDVRIGKSVYTLQSLFDSTVEVDQETIDDISDINEEGYTELENSLGEEGLVEIEGDLVQAGVIKELIKTLAIGGLVRLTKDALTSS